MPLIILVLFGMAILALVMWKMDFKIPKKNLAAHSMHHYLDLFVLSTY